MILRWTWPSYNDSAIRNVSRANVIEIGISYLDNVSSRDVSYCGIIVIITYNNSRKFSRWLTQVKVPFPFNLPHQNLQHEIQMYHHLPLQNIRQRHGNLFQFLKRLVCFSKPERRILEIHCRSQNHLHSYMT